jgi:DNA-binding NarL/FixJ family response regulator
MGPIRVVLADDHTLFRQGTRALLEADGTISVVGEAADGDGAIAVVDRETPDVAILDIEMPGTNGIEATRRIKAAHPQICVLVLTVHDEAQYVFAILEAGAAGYLLKDVDSSEMVRAVHALCRGESVLHPAIARQVLERLRAPPADARPAAAELADREVKVLLLAAKGMTNQDIADKLGVSSRTVQVRLSGIFDALGVGSRIEAVIAALRAGLLDLDELSEAVP